MCELYLNKAEIDFLKFLEKRAYKLRERINLFLFLLKLNTEEIEKNSQFQAECLILFLIRQNLTRF